MRRAEQGFTLVELLVSLLIFGMLSAAGVALLSFSVASQDMADTRLGELADIRRMGALLTSDLAQAAPRVARDEAGVARPAFVGGQDGIALGFVRRGWENFDDAPRASVQKVEYRLVEGRLERTAFRHVDGAGPMPPVVLLDEVDSLVVRFRDDRGAWHERWDPELPTALPRAVELVVGIEDRPGTIRQLFLTGAGA